MKSDPTLKRWYNRINKRFFLDELPRNVVVRWAVVGEENAIASCEPLSGDGRHCYQIILNRDKNITSSQKLSALVHEMVHVACRCRDSHGPLFAEWHAKLTERGVFKKGALLKGICLF